MGISGGLKRNISSSANIRNSVASEPQIVTARSPLIIDGLNDIGSFNRLSPTIWDGNNSKIYPGREGEDYNAGVSSRKYGQAKYNKPHPEALWSPSYFAVSVGGAPLEILKEYINNQSRPGSAGLVSL